MRPYGERHKRRPRGIPSHCWWVLIERREKQTRRHVQQGGSRHEPNDTADRDKQRNHARAEGRRECREAE